MGTVARTESHISGFGPELRFALADMISNKPAPDTKAIPLQNAVDEAAIQETTDYTAKMGRWRTQALNVCKSKKFFAIIKLVSIVRSPWEHFYNFLNVQAINSDVAAHLGGLHVAQLVNGKAQQFHDEWSELLSTSGASSWRQVIEIADAPDLVCLEHMMIDLVLSSCRYFKVRVVDHRVGSYATRLYLLLGQTPGSP